MAQSEKKMGSQNTNQSGRQFDQQQSDRPSSRNPQSSDERNLNTRSDKADSMLKAPQRDEEGNR